MVKYLIKSSRNSEIEEYQRKTLEDIKKPVQRKGFPKETILNTQKDGSENQTTSTELAPSHQQRFKSEVPSSRRSSHIIKIIYTLPQSLSIPYSGFIFFIALSYFWNYHVIDLLIYVCLSELWGKLFEGKSVAYFINQWLLSVSWEILAESVWN